MKKIIIVLSAISFWSCEKALDYEIPYSEPRITLDSRIITDDSVYAFAGVSAFIMDNDGAITDSLFDIFLYEDDAVVEKLIPAYGGSYYDADNWMANKPYYFYKGNYKPKAGHKYRVEAARSGYTTVYGEQTLKDKITVNHWSYDTATTILKVNFTDPAETDDYYRVKIFSRDPSFNSDSPLYFSTSDPTIVFFYEYNDDFEGQDVKKTGEIAFLTDEYFNGKSKELELEIENYYDGISKMELEISRISKELYLFESTKSAQYKSDGFFSEPIQIYNNVENGYGIVGGLTNTHILIK